MITSVMFFPFWFYWMVDTPQTWMTEVYRDVLVYVVPKSCNQVTNKHENGNIVKQLTSKSTF